ncbi:MAG TPA: hypothetical protein VHO47_05760 [Candidatus Babeliales bacterium]|nr:hypothetical protein [Candidatus Babeliales bacterium]
MGKMFVGFMIVSLMLIWQSAYGMEQGEKTSSIEKFLRFLSLTPKKEKKQKNESAHSANSSVQNTPKTPRFSEKSTEETVPLPKSESDPIHSPTRPRLVQFFSHGANGMKNNFHYPLIFELFEQGKTNLAEQQMVQNKITPEAIFEEALRKVNPKVAACAIRCKEADLEKMLIGLIDELKPYYKKKSLKAEEMQKLSDKGGEQKKVDQLSTEIRNLAADQKPLRNLVRSILDRLETDRDTLKVDKAIEFAKENKMDDIVMAINLVVKTGRKMKEISNANIERLENDSDYRAFWGLATGVEMPQGKLKSGDEGFGSSSFSINDRSDSFDSRRSKKNKKKNEQGQAS